MGKKKEVVPFDPQGNPTIGLAFDAMRRDSNIPKEIVQKMASVLEAEINNDGVKVTLSNAKQLNHAVLQKALAKNELVAIEGVSRYYRREIDPETGMPLDEVYSPVKKEDIVKEITKAYKEVTGTTDGPAIDNLWNSLDKDVRLENSLPEVDNTLIQLLPGNFWNTETGDIYDYIPDGMKCFRKLFDTSSNKIKHVVMYGPHDFDGYELVLKGFIKATMSELKEKGGDLAENEDFEFLTTVACGNHDRYMDLLRMFATFFMKNKPLGTYILEGNGRNGKSGIIGLIHTIMGENNTSRLQLAELGNWHKNHCLADTLVNAPDEEKKKALEDTDLFRVIADHGVIELDVMHGQEPLNVTCDFQCVSASNHLPEWEGTDAEACIRRARIIQFRADLSGEDKKNKDFEKETYTPSRIIHFLGVVLGIARYYMTRDFPESNGIQVMRTILQENMVSYRLFYTSFISFFGKYHILRDVYADYVIWCKDKGYKINKYDDFTEAFNESRERATSHREGKVHLPNVYRVSNLQTCFYKDWVCPEAPNYGTIEQMHESGVSVLSIMEHLREQALQSIQKGDEDEQLS